ncbi:MAG TPA: hypothetical protein VG406_14205 [Isosphaeraceae bacterium]|jgi:hypothetical protein|nr:hypothetical protein [Isosphaeraceae bacterium]
MPLIRILLSPDPDGGGGLSEEPDLDLVTVPRSELEALRSQAAEGPRSAREELEAVHARELGARERRASELERSLKEALRDRELATALAGRPLVAGAVPQLLKLWRDEFDVVEERGEYRVVARDGRPVVELVADRLGGPDYAHFRLPTSRGGTAAQGAGRAATPGVAAPGPRTLGEAAIRRWQESAARAGAAPAPIGLGRRR